MSKYKITINGKEYEMDVELIDGSAPAVKAPVQAKPVSAPAAPQAAPVAAAGATVSPMPGTILKVNVKEGDTVKAGDSIVILEAMKMENDIQAPCDGKVASVLVDKGANVDTGAVLVVIE